MAVHPPELVERAARLSTCHLADAMDRIGLPFGALIGLTPIDPVTSFVGPAFTVDLRPIGEIEPDPRNYLDEIGRGHVVVVSADGRLDISVWGGNRSVAAIRRGAVGAVADGAFRDVDEHRALGFPVFGRGPTPVASRPRLALRALDVPVTVCGVVVNPRDLVAGDTSGVIVVPQAHVVQVIEIAEEIAAEEAMTDVIAQTLTAEREAPPAAQG